MSGIDLESVRARLDLERRTLSYDGQLLESFPLLSRVRSADGSRHVIAFSSVSSDDADSARDFFRSIDLQWLLQGTPLSAIGSRLRGGRYNRKGDFEAFYIADTQETALYETEAIFKAAGVVVGVRQPPRVMLSLDYDLQRVVDLREPSVLKSLDLTIDDLKQPWKLAQAENRPVLT